MELIAQHRAERPHKFDCYECDKIEMRKVDPSWPLYECSTHGFKNHPEIDKETEGRT